MVYGFSNQGEFVELREGTNNMVCLADDPNSPGFSVSCYTLELFSLVDLPDSDQKK